MICQRSSSKEVMQRARRNTPVGFINQALSMAGEDGSGSMTSRSEYEHLHYIVISGFQSLFRIF